MSFLMIGVPLVMAAVCALIPSNRFRPLILPATALMHSALTVIVLAFPDALSVRTELLALDAPGKLILLVVSTLFLFCSFYAVGYLKTRQDRPNRMFCVCLNCFMAVMSLVAWSQHLGLLWVAIEATTLVTAPLIYFNHSPKSLEATWKYLLVGSVGIALALFGTYFLAYSSVRANLETGLLLPDLIRDAPLLSKPWLHAAFILMLVGYGTKMGLAPMHTWKPDAYGEAPGVAGAIFAGGITSCAFLAFLRVYGICVAAGERAFITPFLLFMGLFSMAVAGLFMVGQRDFKRMLAYSSVEHMGILVLGLGIGPAALFGTLFHLVTNGLTKGVLFLSAGNIHRAFASKNTDQVSGAIRRLPISGILFLAGFLAITGSPPFGPFISEFAILNGAFDARLYLPAGLFLFFLLLVFIGMGKTVLKVVQGRPPVDTVDVYKDTVLTTAPVIVLLGLVVMLGLSIPAPLQTLIQSAVATLGAPS